MNTLLKYSIVITLLFATSYISAQIVSTGHSDTQVSAYSDNDALYFYSDWGSAALTATPPVGGTNVTYTWEKFQSVGNWTLLITGTEPTLINLTEGAYRVTVNDNGNPAGSDVCWVFQPEILTLEVDTVYSKCLNMQLSATATEKALNYVNPTTGDNYTVEYNYTYNWQADPETEKEIDNAAQPIIEPAVEETTYELELVAFNGAHSMSGSFTYSDPIAVEADFTFNVTDREHPNEIPENDEFTDLTTYTGSAEIIVLLNDSSKGFNKSYKIEFTSDDGEEKPAEDDLIEIVFDELGSYYMTVTVKNDISGCSDSQELGPIDVEEIFVDVPNVFTPDGDGINDKFMAVYSSVKTFKMVIFNRWGRKVFQTTNPGEAWDGKIGGKKAAEGVYFYVITAEGFNKGEHRKLEGPVHLLRGN